jgi:signal transduction histidine kinase
MIPGKGKLVIKILHKDGTVVVEITDNGKGIAKEDITKLFDPFFTVKQNGMGLGLTSTKNILNSHGAEIDVKSEIGAGTTFYIYLKTAQ